VLTQVLSDVGDIPRPDMQTSLRRDFWGCYIGEEFDMPAFLVLAAERLEEHVQTNRLNVRMEWVGIQYIDQLEGHACVSATLRGDYPRHQRPTNHACLLLSSFLKSHCHGITCPFHC